MLTLNLSETNQNYGYKEVYLFLFRKLNNII